MTPTPNGGPVAPTQAEVFKRIRAERDLTQEQLAELAGISRSTVADVERGEKKLALAATILDVAEKLGIPADELLAGAR